jgi:CRISPR-associated protein Cas1
MERRFAELDKAKTANQVGLIESQVSGAHYANLARIFPPELEFETRRNPMTRRPSDATNVINALLNYGFTILKTEIAKQLNSMGLDCYVGFMHHSHAGYTSLVFDMVEPFRHLVDRSVIAIANDIRKDDYYFQIGNPSYPYRSGSPFFARWLILSKSLKKRYVATLTTILQNKRYHKVRVGRHTGNGFAKMEEITIMKMSCFELRDYILERKKTLSLPPKILMR